MQTVLYIIGGLIGLIVIFIVYRYWATIKATQKRDRYVLEQIQPIIDAIDNKTTIDTELIKQLADDPAIRGNLYYILIEHNQTDLFPEQYKNFKSGAESSLVYWLLHPNELGSRPDHIEFVQKVEKEVEIDHEQQLFDYYVFKFKMNPPHWAAKEEWTVGIVGPYIKGKERQDFTASAFSTFERFDSKSPEEHVGWVHEMMKQKGLY